MLACSAGKTLAEPEVPCVADMALPFAAVCLDVTTQRRTAYPGASCRSRSEANVGQQQNPANQELTDRAKLEIGRTATQEMPSRMV
jgi:hypothetical protein